MPSLPIWILLLANEKKICERPLRHGVVRDVTRAGVSHDALTLTAPKLSPDIAVNQQLLAMTNESTVYYHRRMTLLF